MESQAQAAKAAVEISEHKLARETAEARVAVLERTLAQRSAASAAAAEEVESQVRFFSSSQRKATRVRNRRVQIGAARLPCVSVGRSGHPAG